MEYISQTAEQHYAKLPKNISPNDRILEFSITFAAINSLIYGWLQT